MNNSFQDISKSIVKDFLQTVVIFDDKAFTSSLTTPTDDLAEPQRSKRNIVSTHTTQSRRVSQHGINTSRIIKSFADKGLICSVIAPQSHIELEEEIQRTIKIACRSDIVVLDWEILEYKLGQKTLEIIQQILEKDKTPDRIRFICIYTGSNDIVKSIFDSIKTDIFEKNLRDVDIDKANLCFKSNSLLISLFAKKGIGIDEEYSDIETAEEDLPEKIIEHFTKNFSGLIPNAAMRSLTAIRNNNHRILSRFHNLLDAPFLNHRILSEPTIDAIHHITPLITSELQCIIGEEVEKDTLSAPNIKLWIENVLANNKADYNDLMDIQDKDIAIEVLNDLITYGLKNNTLSKNHTTWKSKIKKIDKSKKNELSLLTEIFNFTQKDSIDLDRDLANLMSVTSNYHNTPVLKFGSIISEIDNSGISKYFICIQPICDCTRLSTNKYTEFLFIPCSQDENAQKKNLIVFDKAYIDLTYNLKSESTIKIKFKASESQKVIATLIQDEYIIKKLKSKTYKWICQLRFPVIQRISNEFAREISRVGLTESEWLRRWAK